MTTIVLRVKFPPTYPLIYKTLRVDRNLTVAESVGYIAQTVNVPASPNFGLYVPSQKRWLSDGDQLANFGYLENEDYIEYKDKLDKGSNDSGGCCTIL